MVSPCLLARAAFTVIAVLVAGSFFASAACTNGTTPDCSDAACAYHDFDASDGGASE